MSTLYLYKWFYLCSIPVVIAKCVQSDMKDFTFTLTLTFTPNPNASTPI